MECSQIDLYEFLTESELQQYYNAIKNELKITNAAQFKYATDEDLKNIGLSRPEIRRLRKFYEKHYPHGYLNKIKRLLQTPTSVKRDDVILAMSNSSSYSTETLASTKSASSPNKAPKKTPNNKHIIPADSISVNKQLGTGEFGIVQQGVWKNGTERIQVAIKCLCLERMQSNPLEFLKEAYIITGIEHENIVRLYGMVLATESIMLVTELAHLRSLLECLKDSGLRVSFLTVPTLCEFAMQICNGMRYLENKRLIHRDLAARNILVFSKNKVKISDFGLSRALGVGKDYYKTNFNVNLKLPIAWCAPECINYLRFTNASDVWAFGVCLWEMFSYGFQPWAALTGLQILEAIDAPNFQRLEQPDCCPQEYYTLMMKCWQDDPSKRPKFSEIYEMLPDMKPEQLKAVATCFEPNKDYLLYRQGDIITVLDRNTGAPFWKGVLNSGKTGFFNPSNTVAFLEGLPISSRDSFSRASERSSKRKLRTEMISKPQNDLKHTGHVGIDGASFGDIAFLGSSQNGNHVPRQIVTPYKPSEDIEQTPLLLPPTPTSPDSLQTASGYFPDGQHGTSMNPSFVPSTENTPKHLNQPGQTSFDFSSPHTNLSTNPFASKLDDDGLFAMQNSNYGLDGRSFTNSSLLAEASGASAEAPWHSTTRNSAEEPHVYHEISDDEMAADKLDFGPSLLDEINSMFGSMSTSTASQPKSPEYDYGGNSKNDFDLTLKLVRKNSIGDTNLNATNRYSSSSVTAKKKSAGTVKSISVKDEKILNHAIEIANEISARSMNDLVSDQPTSAQSPKRKFSFRFPHLINNGSGEKHSGGTNANTVSTAAQNLAASSPYAKKKNFTEELKSIPDLQRFRSLSEIKNANSSEIRIPLFDKESSDFCFEKSREILSRPLNFEPSTPSSVHHLDMQQSEKRRESKSISENIIDIEKTLKALNLDFMHTYTDLNKSELDSDETILHEQFSNIVSSIEDEISSAKSAVFNYATGSGSGGGGGGGGGCVGGGGGGGMQTMFDFKAATSHLDKHLHYMENHGNAGASILDNSGSVALDQKLVDDKRSSTPDTGFASRDTNISLSRRSSQKSSYSPQENFYSPKDNHFANIGYTGLKEENPNPFATDKFSLGGKYSTSTAPIVTSPNKVTANNVNSSNNSVFSSHHLKIDGEHFRSGSMKSRGRQRSMSFTDNFNAVSPVLSEPQQRPKRYNNKAHSAHRRSGEGHYRNSAYKSRSIRARTLRRLSYNPMMLDSSSSTSAEESDCNRSIARSECDIRTRMSASSLYRRRRQGAANRGEKVMSVCQDAEDQELLGIVSRNKLYGSNASIKSAPHYNYGGVNRNVGSSMRPTNRAQMYDHQYSYEDSRIYDFGGRGPPPGNGLNGGRPQSMNRSPISFLNANGVGVGGGSGGGGGGGGGGGNTIGICGSSSGSSSATSTAAPTYNGNLLHGGGVGGVGVINTSHNAGRGGLGVGGLGGSIAGAGGGFHEFDVTRLTGKSPTSNFMNCSSPEDRKRNHPSPPKSLPLPLLSLPTTTAKKPQSNKMDFHWPEQIHASTVKQNDMLWRQQRGPIATTSSTQQQLQQQQQQQSQQQQQHHHSQSGFLRSNSMRQSERRPMQSMVDSSSSSGDSAGFEFRTDYATPRIPPSPAP